MSCNRDISDVLMRAGSGAASLRLLQVQGHRRMPPPRQLLQEEVVEEEEEDVSSTSSRPQFFGTPYTCYFVARRPPLPTVPAHGAFSPKPLKPCLQSADRFYCQTK